MLRLSAGTSDQIRATAPERCGAAIDVPLSEAYEPSLNEDRTFTPGAEMSGLIPPPTGEGPRLEKLAITLLMSYAPTP